MRKIIRAVLLTLALLILLLVAAVGIFVAVFDANAYKQELSDIVQKETGRELQFQGDVGLTFYPALGMKLGAMRFANAEGFGELPMLSISEASVSVDLLSLIRFAPEIDKLILRDLEINLMRNPAGVNNWDDLLPEKPASGASGDNAGGSGSSGKSKPAAGGYAAKASLAGVEIENLKLLWDDQQAGERFEVTDLDISTGRIALNQGFPMTLKLKALNSAGLEVAIALKTDLEFLLDQQRLSLQQMKLALNEFEIGGNLQISNFAAPAVRFDLASKRLDVDALLGTLPPADDKAAKKDKKKKDGDGKKDKGKRDDDVKIALPTQVLRDLDIEGKLRIGKLKVQNLKLTDFLLQLAAKDGLISLKPVKLEAYDGKLSANVAVDVRGKLPKYSLKKSFKGIQVGNLLDDYMGESPISGKLEGDVNLASRGEWLSELKKNSDGKMQLAFLDGALKGFNLRQSIEAAKAKIGGDDPPKNKTLKTDFTSLTLSGVIRKGVFSSDDLDLQAPLLRVSGEGEADLNSEEVDYLVNAKLVGSIEGQRGDTADDLAGLTIPVRIKGPFSAPEIDVQLEEMLKAKVDAEKKRLKKEIDEQKKELEKQLKKEKKKLKKSKQRELEKKVEVEKTRAEKKLKEEMDKLLE